MQKQHLAGLKLPGLMQNGPREKNCASTGPTEGPHRRNAAEIPQLQQVHEQIY